MALTQAQYHQIRDKLCHLGDFSNLETLKLIFKDDINSQRVYEKIRSLSHLFRILEKRDCMGPEHQNKLMIMVRDIAPLDGDIDRILYGRAPTGREGTTEEPAGAASRAEENRVIRPVISDIKDRINDAIKREIGIKWKELGRGLGIAEGTLELLESRHRFDPIEAIHEMLRYHKENCDNNEERWRVGLQRALDKARRRDLIEHMDDMLSYASVKQ